MLTPIVSIIIPVYNAQPFLENCLYSISRQSFKDFEAILIDDGSTDSSGHICDLFCQKDPRFTVIHQANSGVTNARNTGIDKARGEYIGFVDSDDWAAEDYLLDLYNTIKRNDSDFVFSAYYRFFSDTFCPYIENKPSDFSLEVLIKEEIARDLCAAVWNQLYRASFLREHSIRFPKYGFAEDTCFCITALHYAPKVDYCPRASYYYRCNPTSLTGDKDAQKRTDLFLAFTNNFTELFDRFGFWDDRPYTEAFYYRMNVEKLCVLRGYLNQNSKNVLSSTFPESYRYWKINTAADIFYRLSIKHRSAFPLKILNRLLKVKSFLKKALRIK